HRSYSASAPPCYPSGNPIVLTMPRTGRGSFSFAFLRRGSFIVKCPLYCIAGHPNCHLHATPLPQSAPTELSSPEPKKRLLTLLGRRMVTNKMRSNVAPKPPPIRGE